MKFTELELPGVILVEPDVHSDDRGQQVVLATVPAGANTLQIAYRQDGRRIDAILITSAD